MSREAEAARARRNLNPHREARLAMIVWGHDYAHKQRGGSMDFYEDYLTESQRKLCREWCDLLESTPREP